MNQITQAQSESRARRAMYGSLIVIVCAIWGFGNIVAKVVTTIIPPLFCLSIRFLLSFLLFALIFRKKAFANINKRALTGCGIIGLLSACVFIFGTLSLTMTAATISGFFMSVAVLFTPFLSFFILKKKIDRRIYPVIFVVIVGAYFLCGGNISFSFGIGEFLALGCSFSLALSLIATNHYIEHIGVIQLSTMQSGVAAIVCMIFAFIFESPTSLANLSMYSIACILYLVVACTIIAYLLQNKALSHVSPVFASVSFSTEPIFTAVAAYFTLGERLDFYGFLGCTLIMTGLLAASLMGEKH